MERLFRVLLGLPERTITVTRHQPHALALCSERQGWCADARIELKTWPAGPFSVREHIHPCLEESMSVHEDRRDAKSHAHSVRSHCRDRRRGRSRSGAFEAQGVESFGDGHAPADGLSARGRSAALCRFGSGAQEISAEADVVWRREAPRGGEFGSGSPTSMAPAWPPSGTCAA